jgi:hypothetical protein
MLKPNSLMLITSAYLIIVGSYYLIRKEKRQNWSDAMKFLFYFGFIVSCLIMIWGIAYVLILYF